MNESARRWDPWAIPTLMLWTVFFAVGLDAQAVFRFLRDISYVVTQNAFVNNPDVITIGLALYFAFFTFHRCREAGLPDSEAHGKAVQTGIVAIVAFLWHPLSLLAHVQEIDTGSISWTLYLRGTVYVMAVLKMLGWFYLLGLVIRYYGLGNRRVFVDMYCVFPSTHRPTTTSDDAHPEATVEWSDVPAAPHKESLD